MGVTRWSRRTPLLLMVGVTVLSLGSPVSGSVNHQDAAALFDTVTGSPQFERHLRFRSGYDFLSTDPADIDRVVRTGGVPEAMETLGLEMSSEEWNEFTRRQRVIDRASDVERLLTGRSFDEAEEALEAKARLAGGRLSTGPVFAGVWQDNLDGGVLKIAVTDSQAIDHATLVTLFERGASDIEIIEQAYSLDELWVWRRLLEKRLQEGKVASSVGFDRSDLGVRIKLSLYPGFHDYATDTLVSGIPKDAIVITQVDGTPRELSTVDTSHGAAQQSGLQIGISNYVPGYIFMCTWGVTGHTSSYSYIVTAGHCAAAYGTSIAGSNIRGVRQNADAPQFLWIAPQSTTFTYARNKDSGATFDHARFSSTYANTNSYHYAGVHFQPILRRRLLDNYHKPETVCASLGASAIGGYGWDCGNIEEPNWSGTVYVDGVGDVWVTNRVQVINLNAGLGDSGAGMVYGGTFFGLLTDGIPGQYVVFEHAYWIKAYMGATFDFNCVKSGGVWTTCPTQ